MTRISARAKPPLIGLLLLLQRLWSDFMVEVSALAQRHPYTASPTARNCCEWGLCGIFGEPDSADLSCVTGRLAERMTVKGCSKASTACAEPHAQLQQNLFSSCQRRCCIIEHNLQVLSLAFAWCNRTQENILHGSQRCSSWWIGGKATFSNEA